MQTIIYNYYLHEKLIFIIIKLRKNPEGLKVLTRPKHTTLSVRSNRKIVETETKSIPLTHMTAHFRAFFLSMCDVKVCLTFTSLSLVLL
jgi:hypothetical protein